MVGRTEHIDAGGGEPRLRGLQFGKRADAQRKMIHPFGRVGRRGRVLVVAEVEKRYARAVGHAKENVRVRAEFLGARHAVLADDVDQRQPEEILVKMPGFLRGALWNARRPR